MKADLHDLVTVAKVDVYKAGKLAAELTRSAQATEFRYVAEYLAQGGPAVATTLPADDRVVVTAAGAVPPFFSGLLPEGRRLTALRRTIKTSADDDLSVLLAVGADLIGNVQVVPHGEVPNDAPPAIETADLSRTRFSEVFARSVGADPDLVGIPGVQEKISARMISIPVSQKTDHFILKLDPPEFRHLVENEAFFLRAAALSGLEVVDSELVRDAEGKAGLLVRRFDRLANGTRLAVEDAGQVLGRHPADKYAVTTVAVVQTLSRLCGARPVAARNLMRQIAFAYVSGNGDAHAKNFAIVQRPTGEWRVAPAYDLPTSQIYQNVDASMALPINGKTGDNITGKDLLALGEHVGVPSKATAQVVDDVCQRVDLWLPHLDDLPLDRGRVQKLRRFIELRRSRLRER